MEPRSRRDLSWEINCVGKVDKVIPDILAHLTEHATPNPLMEDPALRSEQADITMTTTSSPPTSPATVSLPLDRQARHFV